MFYNPSFPRMFLSLYLLSEYRIQQGANGPLYVTSSYSTWIFCREVSGFATDCPCGVWCCGLIHLPPACWSTFWQSNFKQQLGCMFEKRDKYILILFCFDICNYICLVHQIIFRFYLLKYSFLTTLVLTSSIDVVFILSTCTVFKSLSFSIHCG